MLIEELGIDRRVWHKEASKTLVLDASAARRGMPYKTTIENTTVIRPQVRKMI
jgi:hypothetical protein